MKEEIKDAGMLPDRSNASRAEFEPPARLLTGVDELIFSTVLLEKFEFCGAETTPPESLFHISLPLSIAFLSNGQTPHFLNPFFMTAIDSAHS